VSTDYPFPERGSSKNRYLSVVCTPDLLRKWWFKCPGVWSRVNW